MRTHGKASTYRSGGCRCAECRDAHRLAQASLREKYYALRTLVDGRWVAPGHPYQHGTSYWYRMRGCRCDACRAAERRVSRRVGS